MAVAAVIPYIITGLSTTMSMVAANQKAKYEVGMANRNADVTREKQKDAITRGAKEEEQYLQKVEALQGTQRAAMGASGAAVVDGSFGDMLASTAAVGAEDAATIRLNSMREAWGLGEQAKGYQAQAEMAKSAGKWNQMESFLTGSQRAFGIYGSSPKGPKTPKPKE